MITIIIKKRQIPIHIVLLKALLRRLPLNHPKRGLIKKDLDKRNAGYRGEKTLDYYVGHLDLEKDQYEIIQDIRLSVSDIFFQIDTLILTTKFIFIVEAKNLAGELFFKSKQMIQRLREENKGYEDPRIQAERQIYLLKIWLKRNHLSLLPFNFLITISNPSTIIHGDQEVHKTICHANELLSRMEKLENTYQEEKISLKEMKSIRKLLLKKHTPLTVNILLNYHISPSELLKGVQCPDCFFLPILYKRKKWICPNCKKVSFDAHFQALEDYFHLIKTSITNSELCKFLHIPSSDVAKKILISMNLPFGGANKGRIYYLKNTRSNP